MGHYDFRPHENNLSDNRNQFNTQTPPPSEFRLREEPVEVTAPLALGQGHWESNPEPFGLQWKTLAAP